MSHKNDTVDEDYESTQYKYSQIADQKLNRAAVGKKQKTKTGPTFGHKCIHKVEKKKIKKIKGGRHTNAILT